MWTSRRNDLRTRALRAAAKVALLGAGFGCGTAATEGLEAQGGGPDEAPDAGATQGSADAGPEVDAGGVVVSDAGVVDSGLPVDAGARPDAGGEFCDIGTLSNEEYLACCERIGWDWDRGCAAWGPPAPPAMPGEEVA